MSTFTVSAELPAPAQKIWAAMKDAPLIIPKVAPHAVAGIDHVDGPADGVGAVRMTKLVTPPGAFVKEKLVAIDHATMTATTEEVEGGHLGQGFSKWVSTVKFTVISEASCLWETIIDFEGGNEAAIAMTKEKMPKMMAAISEYVNKQ